MTAFAHTVMLPAAIWWTLFNHIRPHDEGRQELPMTPEEIVADINCRNRDTLYARNDYYHLTHDQVLALMDEAAMQGFRMGSNVALSMVKGSLLVQLTRATGARRDTSGA